MAKAGYIFIVWFEFFRSICYYGVQVMLFFVFYTHLGWSLTSSVAMVHLHGIIFYSCAMVGILTAEQRKSCIVNNFGVIAVIGNTLIFTSVLVSDIAESWDYLQLFKEVMVVSGTLLRSIGAGMIREVPMRIGEDMIATEEGDQRTIRSRFYLALFFAFSGAIALAVIVLPTLRMNITWMGKNMCWPLPIGIATISLIIGLLVFNGGILSYYRSTYIPNNITRVMQCITTGDAYRSADYRIGEYDDDFAEDAAQAGRVVLLFIPLPIFWSLFEQLWTRWPYQGLRMDGLINGTVPIEPDTMFLAIPIVNMCVLPFFEYIFFPLLANVVFCRTPKARIIFGALLAIVAFFLAGGTELYVEGEKESPTSTFAPGTAELVIWNAAQCPISMTFKDLPGYKTVKFPKATITRLTKIPCENHIKFTITKMKGLLKSADRCRTLFYNHTKAPLYIYSEKVTSYMMNTQVTLQTTPKELTVVQYPLTEEIMLRDHTKGGLQVPRLGIFYRVYTNRSEPLNECRTLQMWNPMRLSTRKRHLYSNRNHYNYELYPQGKYYPMQCNIPMTSKYPEAILKKGGVYMMNIMSPTRQPIRHIQIIEEPFKTSILWQVPQYAVMALAQLLCPALLLDYSYRQVHRSMVPYLLFMWLFTAALGNLIVFVEALFNFWTRLFYAYIFYMVLMAVAFIVLCVLLFFYEHLEPEVPEEEEGEEEEDEDIGE